MCDAVPLADWKKIVGKAVELAKDGDSAARQWLGRYLIGDPQPEEPHSDDTAELTDRRLALIESYLRPLGLADDRYPPEELARLAAARLMRLDVEMAERLKEQAG